MTDTELDAIESWSGAVGSCQGLTFRPSAFWRRAGKGSYARAILEALEEARAMSTALIAEYENGGADD